MVIWPTRRFPAVTNAPRRNLWSKAAVAAVGVERWLHVNLSWVGRRTGRHKLVFK